MFNVLPSLKSVRHPSQFVALCGLLVVESDGVPNFERQRVVIRVQPLYEPPLFVCCAQDSDHDVIRVKAHDQTFEIASKVHDIHDSSIW